jgi:hypothetical protein
LNIKKYLNGLEKTIAPDGMAYSAKTPIKNKK